MKLDNLQDTFKNQEIDIISDKEYIKEVKYKTLE